MAKFVHRHLKTTRTTVIELEPKVIGIASQYFHLPPEDERLRVVAAEGGEWVASHPGCCDVLMVDGYDSSTTIPPVAGILVKRFSMSWMLDEIRRILRAQSWPLGDVRPFIKFEQRQR